MRLRYLPLATLALPVLALGSEAASAPATTTLVLDSNLVLLLKVAIWLGGIFLVFLAALGLTFFGWDVRNARASILAIQKETKDLHIEAVALLDKLKAESEKVKEEIDKLERLGAELEQEGDFHSDSEQGGSGDSGSPDTSNNDGTAARESEPPKRPKSRGPSDPATANAPPPTGPNIPSYPTQPLWRENNHLFAYPLADPFNLSSSYFPAPAFSVPPRTNIDLIRDVIRESKYEWTSIGRIMNRSALTRDQILEEIRKASDIKIGKGRKTGDFIFKIVEPNS